MSLAAGTFCHAATTVIAWGDNTALQCQVPAGLTNAIAVAAGDSHSLALKSDGSVAGWGQAASPPVLTNAIAIAAGSGYRLALKSNGTVVVWGSFVAPPAWLTNVTAIATGWDSQNPWNHALALRRDGTVVAWGDNTWGQTNVPSGLSNVVGIAAGDGNSLALLANGTIVAWGDDSFGKSEVPPDATNVTAIAAGQDHCLALKSDGTVEAWGNNLEGQATVPSDVTNVVVIAAGQLHSLALKADSSVAAWGGNQYGQATVTPGQTGFIAISGGGAHSLAVRNTGAPGIIQQPASQSVPIGNNASFSVTAAGAPTITYQWRHNLTNLVGATNFTLTLSNVQMTNAGSYTVVAANSYGAVTSAVAMLTVIVSPPFITLPPQNLATNCGDTAVFQVGVSGATPFGYQWLFSAAPIASATNSSLSVSNVTPSLTGQYSVVVTNLYGSVTSAAANLTMVVDSSLLITPLTASGKQGNPFSYAVPARHSPISFSAKSLAARAFHRPGIRGYIRHAP